MILSEMELVVKPAASAVQGTLHPESRCLGDGLLLLTANFQRDYDLTNSLFSDDLVTISFSLKAGLMVLLRRE